jgi:hypothetical protein
MMMVLMNLLLFLILILILNLILLLFVRSKRLGRRSGCSRSKPIEDETRCSGPGHDQTGVPAHGRGWMAHYRSSRGHRTSYVLIQ